MTTLDFELKIGLGSAGSYPVAASALRFSQQDHVVL